MAKDEIITGLTNAIERGEDMQHAIQTLLSAGYTMQEIQEASREINIGAIQRIGVITPKQQIQPLSPPGIISSPPSALTQEPVKNEANKNNIKKVIILGIIFLLLLIILVISWLYLF